MRNTNAGFTLMELLLVVVIIGAILAVVIPRGHRASVDAKYQLVRQNCSELAAWADEWAKAELERQAETFAFKLNHYYVTLGNSGSVDWVAAATNASNWQGTKLNIGTAPTRTPDTTVLDIMPGDKMIRNPFNGASVFISSNNPGSTPIPGAIGCAYATDTDGSGSYNYFALVFQGRDSTSLSGGTGFYAGQDDGTLEGLRNGVFMARLLP